MNIDELLPFYALDAVTDEERRFVEAQLAQDETLQAELEALRQATDVLALDTTPMLPPPAIKTALLDRVEASAAKATPAPIIAKHNRPRPSWLENLRARWAMPMMGFSMAVATFALIWAFTLFGRLQNTTAQLTTAQTTLQETETRLADANDMLAALDDQVEMLQTEISTLSVTNAALQEQIDGKNRQLAFYNDPTLSHIAVPGTDSSTKAAGMYSVDEAAQQAALWVWGMDILDEHETYQLWYIHDDQVASGGVFTVGEDGKAWIVYDSAETAPYNAIGVSIEPVGGSEMPSEEIVLLGSS